MENIQGLTESTSYEETNILKRKESVEHQVRRNWICKMNLQYVCKFNSVIPGIMPSVSIPSIIKHEWRIKMKCQTCKWHKNSRFAKNMSKQTLAKTQKEINLCNIIEGIKCYQATNQWLWVTNRNLSNSTVLLLSNSTQQCVGDRP